MSALTAVLTLLLLAGMEIAWRAGGMRPTVSNSPTLWAVHRNAASARGRDAVALVGTSRLHNAVDPAVAASRMPRRPVVQLAVGATHPYAAFRHLATDPTVTGLIVVGLLEEHLVDPAPSEYDFTRRADAGLSVGADWATRISAWTQSHLIVASPDVGWRGVGRRVLEEGRLRSGRYSFMTPGRFHWIDFGLTDAALHRSEREAEQRAAMRRAGPIPAAWDRGTRVFAGLAERVAARGGRVAFVRMPTDGAYEARFDRHYPRSRFWDRFAAQFADEPNVTAIHFEDVPGMTGLSMPDASHLDASARPAFTAALLSELERRGVLQQEFLSAAATR